MGKFSITKKTAGQYYFNLKADNGMVILSSQGYSVKTDCERAIELVKANITDENMFDRKKIGSRKFYFNLKAVNEQIIGTSQTYVTAFALEKGIESVIKNGSEAIIEDRTVNRIAV